MSAALCPACGLEADELAGASPKAVCDICKMEAQLAAKEGLGDALNSGFKVTDVHQHTVTESIDADGNVTRHEVVQSTTYGGFLGVLVGAWRWLMSRFSA